MAGSSPVLLPMENAQKHERLSQDINVDLTWTNQAPIERCGECDGPLRLPKLLDCLHSICEPCLKRCTGVYGENGKPAVECPVKDCHARTLIPQGLVEALPPNFLFLLSQESATGLQWCGECVDNEEAESVCVECGLLLCPFHAKSHRKSRSTFRHSLQPINDRTATATSTRAERHVSCALHVGEVTTLFCRTCERACCCRCTEAGHMGHNIVLADEMAAEMRSDLRQVMRATDLSVGDEMANLVATINTRLDQLEDQSTAASEKIIDVCGRIKQSLETRKRLLLRRLDHLKDEKATEIKKAMKDFQKAIPGLYKSTGMVEDVLSDLSQHEQLHLFPVLKDNLQRVRSEALPAKRAAEKLVFEREELVLPGSFSLTAILQSMQEHLGDSTVVDDHS